jgi:hypothetical protein
MRPDFSTPFFLAVGFISFMLVAFFPFALWARRIARPDALNAIESYLLGQTCGPVGVWLVLRANEAARRRAEKVAFAIENRTAPEVPEAIDRRKRITEGIPSAEERPGSRASKPPPARPTAKHERKAMDTWSPSSPGDP